MALLRDAVPDSGPTPEALVRASAVIGQETADERRDGRLFLVAAAAAVGVAWVFQLMVGSGFVVNGPELAGSLLVLFVAIASITVLRERPRSALLLIVATSALFALRAGNAGGLAAGIGIRCSFREMWAAGLTWALVGVASARFGVALDRWSGAAAAAAGALAAHAGQHLACEVPHAHGHVLAFHFSVVTLVALLGALTAAVGPRPARAER